MIDISHLQVVRDGKPVCTVARLALAAGDQVVVTGANGSGKTTLLRVLAGLETDYGGGCLVEVDHRRRTYLHQHPLLFRGTVLANVKYAERSRAGGTTAATRWLERLAIEHLAQRTTQHLSGGEARRVALARALACEPELLLLDEPLAQLDTDATDTVCRVLRDLTETTIVVASPHPLPDMLPMTTFQLDKNEEST